MKVSVVIRAYNEDEHIEKLLLGISAQSLKADEVILVDSGSTDNTVEIARRYGCTIVSIEKHEFTFGRALNRGCAAASGDICVFPSGHVFPTYHNWLEALVAQFNDECVALSYGRQRGSDINKFSEHQIFARWYPTESVCPQKSYFCNNANCAIRRSAWETLAYDETLTGLEDLAWGKAVQANGGWIAYVAEAEVVHVHDETWEQIQNRYRREAMAMRGIDDHATFTRLDLVWLLARNIFSDASVALRQGVFSREATTIIRFRYNQLLGTWRGFNGPPDISAELRACFYYPSSPHTDRLLHLAEERHLIDYNTLKATAQPTGTAGADVAADGTEDDESIGAAAVIHMIRKDR